MSIQWSNNVNLVRIKMTLEQVCPLGEAIGSYSALRGTSKDTERETEKIKVLSLKGCILICYLQMTSTYIITFDPCDSVKRIFSFSTSSTTCSRSASYQVTLNPE